MPTIIVKRCCDPSSSAVHPLYFMGFVFPFCPVISDVSEKRRSVIKFRQKKAYCQLFRPNS
uniref:Uncharacterized protein n=1 Tax=Parascaris univalens TaxID=6257 RepID=A0A914ZVF2_PARUN